MTDTTARLGVIIHDVPGKPPISTHICDTRGEAAEIVRRELSRIAGDGYLCWLRSPDVRWPELPVLCRIVRLHGPQTEVYASIEPLTMGIGGAS